MIARSTAATRKRKAMNGLGGDGAEDVFDQRERRAPGAGDEEDRERGAVLVLHLVEVAAGRFFCSIASDLYICMKISAKKSSMMRPAIRTPQRFMP
jgi:hypothetical protein